MIHLPTFDEQVFLCKSFLYSCSMKNTRKKFSPETIRFCLSNEAFIVAVNQILKDPLTENERYYFIKNVINKNRERD